MSELRTTEIVRFANVSKRFRSFDASGGGQPFLLRTLGAVFKRRKDERDGHWPLRDVTFDVVAGQALGVIGLNGTGKSTMLRLIAGACFPTEGVVSVRGRIAPLLSLGVGFHPDMTGRECVHFNATLFGLSREEIEARLSAIIAFAELETFIDTPMRFYSSGMQARLGFAVAVHTEPDLLLIDEVLAVGDHAFREKCAARLNELKADGTTIILVSHSDSDIRRFCDRAIWLKDGRIERDGDVGEVVDAYLAGTGT